MPAEECGRIKPCGTNRNSDAAEKPWKEIPFLKRGSAPEAGISGIGDLGNTTSDIRTFREIGLLVSKRRVHEALIFYKAVANRLLSGLLLSHDYA